jgi:hypothetical protein
MIAFVGYASVAHSLAQAMRTRAPAQAVALASWDGRMTAALARKLIGPDADQAIKTRSERLARLALRQDATTVAAATTLGLHAQLRGESAKARRLLAYSETLSRRDFQTHLWAIEDAVARDDMRGALRRYDAALRTSRTAPDILFPVLRSAISDPVIRTELVRTLLQGPAWTEAFVYDVARNAPDPLAAANLFGDLTRAGIHVGDDPSAFLIGKLVASGHFETAWRQYRLSRPKADRTRSRDPHFTADLDVPAPFDWAVVNEAGLSASIQSADERGVFYFSAPAGVGGTVLSQLQMLTPGDYVLEGRSAGIDQPARSRPYWVLSCRNSGEVGRVDLPPSGQANGHFRGRFTVPAGCAVQSLTLVVRASDAVDGVSGEIHMVTLRRSS